MVYSARPIARDHDGFTALQWDHIRLRKTLVWSLKKEFDTLDWRTLPEAWHVRDSPQDLRYRDRTSRMPCQAPFLCEPIKYGLGLSF
jgi:hypothetical protein